MQSYCDVMCASRHLARPLGKNPRAIMDPFMSTILSSLGVSLYILSTQIREGRSIFIMIGELSIT